MASPDAADEAIRNPPPAWSRRDGLAGLALLVLFVTFTGRSWLAWGHVISDFGREMFVPLRVAEGDLLYGDVRYPYGPLSPYLHAALYRLWHPHLAVLYASGLTATALIVGVVYLIGRQIGSVAAAGIAAALVSVDLVFRPSIPRFGLVFPYAFPALHGLLLVLIALAAALSVATTCRIATAVVAGTAIGLALLTKQEFGVIGLGIAALACVGLIVLHGRRPSRSARLALLVPAVALPVAGYGALATVVPVSTIVGRGLFAPEYFGWPITWKIAGLNVDSTAGGILRQLGVTYAHALPLLLGGVAMVFTVGWAFTTAGVHRFFRWPIRLASLAALLFLLDRFRALAATSLRVKADPLALRYAYLPPLLVAWLCVETGVAVVAWRREGRWRPQSLRRWMVVVVAAVMLVRVLGNAIPGSYASFYLPPGLVLLSTLLVDILPRMAGRVWAGPRAARAGGVLVLTCLVTVAAVARWKEWGTRTTPLRSPRGTMFLPRDKFTPMYRAALDVITTQTQPGGSVLAIPTETSLYFLSGRGNHLYETSLVTSVTTEDAERAYVAELEADPPVLVLTSSRILSEYGRGYFGLQYGRRIYDWIRAHYDVDPRPIGGRVRMAVWRPRVADLATASPGAPTVTRDVVYATVDDEDLTLDIVHPTGFAGPRPVLMFFHGGGWTQGHKSDALPDAGAPWAFRYATSWPTMQPYVDLGMALVTVEYRLADDSPAPAAVVDALAAISWLGEHASTYELDPSRIVVIGPSVGGQLALMVALTQDHGSFVLPSPAGSPRPRVIGAIDLYGPTDVWDLAQGPHARPWAQAWLGGAADRKAMARRVSPIEHVHPGAPPVMIAHGDQDREVPYEHALRLRDALAAAGVPVELHTLRGPHGFLSRDEQARLTEWATGFLAGLGVVQEPGGGPAGAVASSAPAGASSGR